MKRALSFALVLAAALALLAWLAYREAPLVAPALAPQAASETEQETEVAAPSTDASGAREDLSPRRTAQDDPKPTSAALAKGPRPWRKISLLVTFARTHEPVKLAVVRLTFDEPDSEPVPLRPGADVGTKRAGGGEMGKERRMEAREEGRFALALPVGTRLRFADVGGNPLMLAGSSTEQNASARFRPLHAALDQLVGSTDIELALEVEESRDLAGVVRDARGGAAIPGARISTETLAGSHVNLRSEEDGRFVLAETGPRPRLHVTHDDYCPLDLELGSEDLAAGAPELVILLERALHVSGQVVDARGSPVKGVCLALDVRHAERAHRGWPSDERLYEVTDARGAFRFEKVPPSADSVLERYSDYSPDKGFLVPRRELGPLFADVEGLVLVSPDSATISVKVSLLDGKLVNAGSFHLECERPENVEWLPPRDFKRDCYLRVPVGVELQLVALARAKPDDPDRMLVGRRNLVVNLALPDPQEVRIVLADPLDYAPPPLPTGAQTFTPYASGVQATLDLRLLDRHGIPLPSDTNAALEFGGRDIGSLQPADGWIRLRSSPGKYSCNLTIGDRSESFELSIPLSGYARVEKCLRIGP